MQDAMSELTRKYREELLRMHAQTQSPAPATPAETQDALDEWQRAGNLPDPLEETVLEELESEQPPSPTTDPETVYEDPVLPDYILPPVDSPLPLPTPALPPEPLPASSESGQLQVITVTGNTAFPVPNAKVSVILQHGTNEHLAYVLTTDENGMTPLVSLPTPPAALSLSPDNPQPYALCDIRVTARGFFRNEALSVPLFSGITSRQVFQLIPLPAHLQAAETIQYPTDAPSVSP